MKKSKKGKISKKSVWVRWKRYWVKLYVAWVVLWGVMAALGYEAMTEKAAEERKEVLGSMCDERARMLQDQFSVSVNHVRALAILVSTFYHNKSPSALDQREQFEKQQGWTIRSMNDREPSPVEKEYAPVIFSQDTVSYLKSLDMMSGKEDRANIERARETGKAVLTNPFRLLESNHLGVILTFPVYHSDLPTDVSVQERIEAIDGYLGGAFDVESLVENLLRQLADNQDIEVNVYDVTTPGLPLIMYGPQHPNGDVSLSHVSMLDFGDPFRRHQMECRYNQRPPILWWNICGAVGVFVICVLIGYISYAAIDHIIKVEEDYNKMEELKVKAEAADIAKSQFLATVSHEIRTPMNGVLGMLDMLLDTNLDSTQKDYARTAEVCGKTLISLINEVLDRAKIEAGKLELEAVPFDIRAILDDVLSLFSSKSRAKRIELAGFVSDKVPKFLVGDPGRFRQIITNLVGNSVKFTEQGHIFVQVHLADHAKAVMAARTEAWSKGKSDQVEVRPGFSAFNTLSGVETADERNSWESFRLLLADQECNDNASDNWTATGASSYVNLMVSVEDTGIGIPLHAQDRVFTPFMQADSSTSRTYGGTGIGLSISKCLVELMGGQINFISRPNIGSTFTFTAKFKECNKDALSDLKKPLSEALPGNLKGLKVVIVDGRQVRAAVTKYHLQRLGIAVEIFGSIKAVRDTASTQNGFRSGICKQPCVILMENDLLSSEMEVSNAELLSEWTHGYKSLLPKKILLVASESDKSKFEAFFDSIIMKPLRASTVAACLQHVLETGNRRQQEEEMLHGSAYLHGLLFGKNMLVVDDNIVNRRVAAGALQKYGANVKCVESGKHALSLLQPPHKFDACFMDIQMPEMDGFEATRQIRLMESKENERIQIRGTGETEWHLPILAMTADVIQATYDECLKCGMDGYVSKPFDVDQLYKAVARFFESKLISDP
ncbi:Histidine kinase 4 [Acorus calamus]|uniref:histidine kinase n=1 Tax=Acorus calamus TaxID=4465 RepID=A0AAV9DJZ0_ACOCL|nr:Histidine kinase 4 [Acorus calamus]